MQDGNITKNKLENQSNSNSELSDQNIQQEEELVKVNPISILDNIEIKQISNFKEIKKMEQLNNPHLNQYGVENLKDLVKLSAKVFNGIKQSITDDGKFTFGDLKNFLPLIPSILVSTPNFKESLEEALDYISEEEFGELKTSIIEEIDFEDPMDDEFLDLILEWLYVTSNLIKNRIEKKKKESSTNG